MAAVGVENVPAGRISRAGYASSPSPIKGWRASAAHDANLRMEDATRFGIAASPSKTEAGKLYWTLIVRRKLVRRA